jgi:choline-sulfatase
MVVSLIHPHDPYVPRPEFWNLYSDEEIDMPQTGLTDDPHTLRVHHGIGADAQPVTEQEIRNARHGYYANTSYFDSKVGEIVKALEESGQLENTIVIVTSDHGDMLGERGLWYKMSFFEHSARIPMIIAGPGVGNRTVAEPVSLLDILPTFLDIAASTGQTAPDPAMDLDGRSLWPLLQGAVDNPDGGEVLGEYCAECASHPIFMIRRGPWKYIHCEVDPPQLFDVSSDPFERENLADDPAHAQKVAEFKAFISEK